MRNTITTALFVVLVCASISWGTIDSMYRAGRFVGHYLYWLPKKNVEPDTLEWQVLAGVIPPSERRDVHSVASAAAVLTERDWALFRVKECSAMGLMILTEAGYHVCVLSQWHSSLRNVVKVSLPGMSQKRIRHSLVSDFLFEPIERVRVSEDEHDTWRVEAHFPGRGYSIYEGKDPLEGDNAQMMGTSGFSIRSVAGAYYEDLNVRRKIFAVYLVAPGATKASDIVGDIEKRMDARMLDLSYTIPEIVPVDAGHGKEQ